MHSQRHPRLQPVWNLLGKLLLLPLLTVMVSGCLFPPQNGVSLIASPERLDFGTNQTTLTLTVSKNFTQNTMGPVVIKGSASWLTVGGCTSPSDECFTNGPGDALRIPITVDRSKTLLGANRAQLTLNADGAQQKVIEVFVSDLLQVQFDVSKRTAKPNELLLFTDKTLVNDGSAISKWEWDFGDGATSASKNPQHRYANPGVYDVTLKVTTGSTSETFTSSALVTVKGTEPVVDFTGTPKILLEGETVRFTQLASSPDLAIRGFSWNFGDGGSSAEPNPNYTYNVAGVYSVTLTVSTDLGDFSATKNQYVIVNPKEAPVSRFTASTLNGFVNFPIQFTDISLPGSAPIHTWQWNFGDGATSTQRNPQHTYTAIGTYTVTLTVTTAHGASSSTATVNITFKPPTADFTTQGNLTNPAVGENVSFLDASAGGSGAIVSWQWNFGDGTTSTQQNPIKAYANPGVYTVSLTVTQNTASNNTATVTKTAYISVFAPPVPNFTFTPAAAYSGSPVSFNNSTSVGGGSNIAYAWDFENDGIVDSAQTNPTHTYTQSGTYTVRLTATVTRPVSGGTFSATTTRTVVVDDLPVVEFSADSLFLQSGETANFTDESVPGSSPITAWSWSFGDGGTSNEQNPSHVYETEGTFTVTLTVTTQHSGTGTARNVSLAKSNYITVSPPVPPTADFTANPTVSVVGQAVTFTNTSTLGTAVSATYLWDFGDGNTSTLENPSHIYNELGDFTVSLTITTSVGSDTKTIVDYITVRNTTDPLADYVSAPDPNYSYSILEEGTFTVAPGSLNRTAKLFIVDMKSQKWRDLSDYFVTSTLTDVWQHYMYVICPLEVKNNNTMLFIEGGSNGGTVPTFANLDPNNNELIQSLGILAEATNTVITILRQVPNQSLSFWAESGGTAAPLRSRTEDEIIAFTFDQFLNEEENKSNHETWPLLLPMVKSAVAAMDTVQKIYEDDAKIPPCTTCGTGNRHPVRDFFVTGASKRGWTTWLTGAVDPRVKAIAPMVIDVLNMDRQMEHHFNAYGYWAPSIYPYAQEQVFDRFLDPIVNTLLDIVDPFNRRNDVAGIPKFLLNSPGDQFFVPDSAQFYFDQLPGEKFLNYVPNSSHGLLDAGIDLLDPNTAASALFSFYVGFVKNVARPTFTWEYNPDGTISVSSPRQMTVTQWRANNPNARDFRKDKGITYVSTPLSLGPDGKYTTTVKNSDVTQGWSAVYIQVRFTNTAQINLPVNPPPFVFTTPVRILPENPDGSNLYPEFNGQRTSVPGNGFSIPVAVVQGSAYDMGFQYGSLMSAEINALLPSMLAAAQTANPLLTNENLDSVWAALLDSADVRVLEEVTGIADGSGLDFATVARANMVALLDTMTGTAISTTRDKTSNGQTLSSTTLDWTLGYGLQDYPCVVVYIPGLGQGVPHANATFAGLVSSFAGLNLGGIMVGAVIDPDQVGDPAPGDFVGQHVSTLTRELLYNATSYGDLSEELGPYNSGISSNPTKFLFRRQHLVVSDGGNWRKSFKVKAYPGEVIGWDDDSGMDEFQPFGRTSYSVSEGTGFETTIFDFLFANDGSITRLLLDGLTSQITANGTNLLNAQYEVNVSGATVSLWVSYAQGNVEAKQIEPVEIKLLNYLP